ncbi:MAG: RNA polymerase sigma factor [Planctomycetota bacterium JB042]
MDRLLADARNGSTSALEEIARRFRPLVATYLERRVGSHIRRREAIDDLTQEVFARVLPALDTLPPDATLDTLAGRLLKNAQWVVAASSHRAARFAGESAAPDAAVATPERTKGPVTLKDELDRLRALTDRMADPARRVLLGRMEGRSFEELAAESGEKVDTVRKRYLRALKELRERMGGGPDGPG